MLLGQLEDQRDAHSQDRIPQSFTPLWRGLLLCDERVSLPWIRGQSLLSSLCTSSALPDAGTRTPTLQVKWMGP